jgi:cytidyltransferase-like protein
MIVNKISKTEVEKEKIIAVSGYFDPIHIGHLEYLKLAKQLGGKLIVILNSDFQCVLKKGRSFMNQEERTEVLKAIKYVDEVFLSIDKDMSVCKSLRVIKPDIFAKGGDRFSHEVPEAKVCEELGIVIVDGLGKKIQSSSKLTGLKEKTSIH